MAGGLPHATQEEGTLYGEAMRIPAVRAWQGSSSLGPAPLGAVTLVQLSASKTRCMKACRRTHKDRGEASGQWDVAGFEARGRT